MEGTVKPDTPQCTKCGSYPDPNWYNEELEMCVICLKKKIKDENRNKF